MPRGVYEKSRNYRKTEKLTEALTALKSREPYFQLSEHMTNNDVFDRLKEFGFVYRKGTWRLAYKSRASSNGHKPLFSPRERDITLEHPVTITPVAMDRLEMCLRESDLEGVQGVIDAMHTLGFKVEIKIVGTR